MKRLYILLAFIFCATICFAQAQFPPIQQSQGSSNTEVYSRNSYGVDSAFHFRTNLADTTVANKAYLNLIGGNVILANDTLWKRNTTRTRWDKVGSGGGSSSQNLAQVVTLGNSTSGSIITGKKDSVGYVFRYGWSTNPLSSFTDNTATATVTTDGIRTALFGTAARNLNNFLDLPNLKVGVENYTVTWTMVIKDSAASNGVAMATIVGGTAAAMMAHYIITDSISYIVHTNTVSTFTTADITNRGLTYFKFFQNDTIQFTFQRRSRVFTYSMKDINTGSVSTFTQGNTIFSGVGNLRLYDYGGTWHLVDSFRVKYDEQYNPTVASLTDSWGYGGGAKTEWAGHWLLSTAGLSAVRMSGPGETSAQAVNRFGDLILIHPQWAGWFLGINDLNGNGAGPNAALDSFCKRTIRFIVLCQANSIIPFLSTLGPQVTDAAKYNDSIYHIAGRYGNLMVLPTYETLKDPTNVYMASQWITNDAVHPNNAGHYQLALMERKKYDSLFAIVTPIELQNIPKTTSFKGYLVSDDGNHAAIAQPGSDPNYIINQPLVNSTVNPQDANMFITGTTWMTSNVRLTPPGTSITAAPYFSMDFTGITAQPFTSRNGTTVGGHWAFDGTIANSTDAIDLLNDIKFKPLNYPFKILAKGITTSKVAFSVNNESATVTADDSIMSLHINDSAYAWFNRFGGLRVRYNSGYNTPMDYTLLSNTDWPSKRHVDSLIAGVVAGVGGVTSYTDGGGFDGTIVAGALSLKTQIGNHRILFSDNSLDMKGTDSLLWNNSRIEIPNFSLANSGLKVGEINLQTALSDNSFIGFGVQYATGFKRTDAGQHGALLYQLSGDVSIQVNSATGAVGSAWSPTAVVTVKNTGRFGFANVTLPNSWAQLVAGSTAVAPLTFTAGTNLTTPLTGAVEYDGTNYFVTSSTPTRFILAKTLTATATLDFPSTGAGAVADLTIALTGAATGDVVVLGIPNASVTTTATYTAWVSSANTVSVRFSPKATEDPASATFRVSVVQY